VIGKTASNTGPVPGAIILAGGKGERLRPDKGCLLVGGVPIVARVVAAARAVCEQVVIVGSAPLPEGLGVSVAADADGPAGPVRGLATGLSLLDTTHAYLLAWDMPFVEPALLGHMAAVIGADDAIVPRIAGRPQPLCALYARACLAALAALPPRGEGRGPSLTDLLSQVSVHWLEEAELAAFGDPERILLNVNTPADLARAQELA